MDPSDEMLLQALIEGRLQEEDRLRVDDLLTRSNEARRQLSEWRGWKELDISLVAMQKPPADESAQLQIAIQTMQSEVAGMGSQIANRTTPYHDLGKDSELDSVESEAAWISHIAGIKVGGVIGRVAMGVVYEGFDQSLGRRVAIKIPSRHSVRNPESRERFAREAQAAAQLCHVNIVAIHSIQHVDGIPILVQQFIDGETLKARVESTGPLSASDLIELATQIARGLAAAHAAGIVHRDLKPENLLIERGTNVVRIADFGLAKRDSSSVLTQPNVVAGTPAYMSPEQTLGQALDPRSDLLLIKDVAQRTTSATEFLNQLSERRLPATFWSTKRLALGSGALIASAVLLWVFFVSGNPDRPGKMSVVPSQDGGLDIAAIEFPFGIRGVGSRFRSLEEAIRSANDGQEITVDRDGRFETSQIDIGGKRISIVANNGASPLFVPSKGPVDSNQQFLTSDSDLRLSGIRVEWPVEIDLTDLPKMLEMPAIFCNGGALTLDDCAIKRGLTGICACGSRSIAIRRCTFEGGTHCLGWTARGDSLTVQNSTLRGKNGFLIVFPPANLLPKGTGQIKIVDVSFIGEAAIELGLTRAQTNAIQFQSEDCVFDTTILISLFGGPPLARQIAISQSMLTVMQGTLVWKESNSRHRYGQSYLSGRLLRQPERRYSSEVVDLEAWRKLWQTDFPGSIEFN